MTDLDSLNRLEIAGHRFELIRLEKVGEYWLVQFAIDGKKRDPFHEPHSNVEHMSREQFMTHLKAQSLIGLAEAAA